MSSKKKQKIDATRLYVLVIGIKEFANEKFDYTIQKQALSLLESIYKDIKNE